MRSSQIISLFSDRPEVGPGPTSYAASVLAHGLAIGLLVFGIVNRPKVNDRILTERYTMRHLDLQLPDLKKLQSAGSSVDYPGPQAAAQKSSAGGKQQPEQEAVLRQIAKADHGPQTLVQPDIAKPVRMTQETPVPTVVIWAQKKIEVKTIVAPQQEKPAPSIMRPSIERPNQEKNLADIRMSATDQASPLHAVLPSTTSPLVVHGPEPPKLTQASPSQLLAQPTPVAVMALSDLQTQTALLPPVNQTASANLLGALAQGKAGNSANSGAGNAASKAAGKGAGEGSGDSGDPKGTAGKQDGTKTGPAQSTEAASGSGNQPSTAHITLPISGQFGSVVVGSSIEEKYPETVGLWSGRMAYTVYLHVGLSKSWILQYSLPRAVNATAASVVAHLEAPWPYNIVRPNITPGAINADALMVHGFVNKAGRFEVLSVVFPTEFAEAQFVLNALEQWQFRPATQNGQGARVEVLLIIPEEDE
jgi:hypothetical protein